MIPHRMMHELEMPLPLTRFQVHGYEAFGKEIVARPVASVHIQRRRLYRKINEPRFGIRRDLSPHSSVAGPFPRSVFPRVIAELAGIRDGIESPDLPAGPNIERAHQPFRVPGRVIVEGKAFF